ncbi:rna-directed dna polymerase from mobile element jockey-like [Limosa lapponica baueri]|uniref:Rna-directed dna polymerase from mobile element jockey-like n=1 Tax=Limosa lapponica baueri TaxID=1758121 RepID=A0A2I0TYL6_LIMLA|nr:rna-directed dna polymerase from mobile element jockey-like [Limosa lapponica baueri]
MTQWIKNWLDGHTHGVAVNGLMSKWRSMRSDVPQGIVLGPVPSNVFVGDMDSAIECTLSKIANNTKLCGAVDTLEGRDAIEKDLDRLDRWACANFMTLKKAKCKVLQMCWGNPKHKYGLGGKWLQSSPEENDLGVLVDEKLNMNQYCVFAAQKATHILGCTKRSMASKAREGISALLLHSGETPLGVPRPALGLPT